MGIYSNLAKETLEKSTAFNEAALEDKYSTNLFYGSAEVIVSARSYDEAKLFEKLAVSDFSRLKASLRENAVDSNSIDKILMFYNESERYPEFNILYKDGHNQIVSVDESKKSVEEYLTTDVDLSKVTEKDLKDSTKVNKIIRSLRKEQDKKSRQRYGIKLLRLLAEYVVMLATSISIVTLPITIITAIIIVIDVIAGTIEEFKIPKDESLIVIKRLEKAIEKIEKNDKMTEAQKKKEIEKIEKIIDHVDKKLPTKRN